MNADIRYIKRNDIDILKWDHCIESAGNGLIYGHSYYLDHMSRHWDALVSGDYETVMPLTWNKKFGLHYLYQPPFTASLGIFGNELDDDKINAFIHAIPKKFKLIEIDLNHANILRATSESIITRTNFVLYLGNNYQEISKNYRENIKRNVRKAEQFRCRYDKNIPIDLVIDLAKKQMETIGNISPEDYQSFKNLFEYLHSIGKAVTCGVYSEKNELLSSCVYFFSHNRAYYILVGNHPNGKTMGTSHYLIDRFIFEHAGKSMMLDFEGSDVRNLAFFYSSFGAVAETYPALRINRLPFWAKLFK